MFGLIEMCDSRFEVFMIVQFIMVVFVFLCVEGGVLRCWWVEIDRRVVSLIGLFDCGNCWVQNVVFIFVCFWGNVGVELLQGNGGECGVCSFDYFCDGF